jgi:hypothetical protein
LLRCPRHVPFRQNRHEFRRPPRPIRRAGHHGGVTRRSGGCARKDGARSLAPARLENVPFLRVLRVGEAPDPPHGRACRAGPRSTRASSPVPVPRRARSAALGHGIRLPRAALRRALS